MEWMKNNLYIFTAIATTGIILVMIPIVFAVIFACKRKGSQSFMTRFRSGLDLFWILINLTNTFIKIQRWTIQHILHPQFGYGMYIQHLIWKDKELKTLLKMNIHENCRNSITHKQFWKFIMKHHSLTKEARFLLVQYTITIHHPHDKSYWAYYHLYTDTDNSPNITRPFPPLPLNKYWTPTIPMSRNKKIERLTMFQCSSSNEHHLLHFTATRGPELFVPELLTKYPHYKPHVWPKELICSTIMEPQFKFQHRPKTITLTIHFENNKTLEWTESLNPSVNKDKYSNNDNKNSQ